MNVQTISRLFFIAASRIKAQESYLACYHFGAALALSNLPNTNEDDCNGYYREADIRRHVELGKICFRSAKHYGMITPRY